MSLVLVTKIPTLRSQMGSPTRKWVIETPSMVFNRTHIVRPVQLA